MTLTRPTTPPIVPTLLAALTFTAIPTHRTAPTVLIFICISRTSDSSGGAHHFPTYYDYEDYDASDAHGAHDRDDLDDIGRPITRLLTTLMTLRHSGRTYDLYHCYFSTPRTAPTVFHVSHDHLVTGRSDDSLSFKGQVPRRGVMADSSSRGDWILLRLPPLACILTSPIILITFLC